MITVNNILNITNWDVNITILDSGYHYHFERNDNTSMSTLKTTFGNMNVKDLRVHPYNHNTIILEVE